MFWSIAWYYILVILTIADVITTKICLAAGHRELNWVVATGFERFIELKIVALVAILVLMISIDRIVSLCLDAPIWTHEEYREYAKKISSGNNWVVPAGASLLTLIPVVNNALIALYGFSVVANLF